MIGVSFKNRFIKEESLPTEDYLAYFFPFDKLDFRKKGVELGWSVTDRESVAITMTMVNAPQAVAMGLQKEYKNSPVIVWDFHFLLVMV